MAIKRTMTDHAINANRRNAAGSTGPTTPEGKRWSRRNALKHGILSEALMFKSSEERLGFRQFLDELEREEKPRDTLERVALEEFAIAYFRRRRWLQWEQRIYRKSNTTAQSLEKTVLGNSELLGVKRNDMPEKVNGWPCTEMSLVRTKGVDHEPRPWTRAGDENSENHFEMRAKWQDPIDGAMRYGKETEKHLHRALDKYLRLRKRKL